MLITKRVNVYFPRTECLCKFSLAVFFYLGNLLNHGQCCLCDIAAKEWISWLCELCFLLMYVYVAFTYVSYTHLTPCSQSWQIQPVLRLCCLLSTCPMRLGSWDDQRKGSSPIVLQLKGRRIYVIVPVFIKVTHRLV